MQRQWQAVRERDDEARIFALGMPLMHDGDRLAVLVHRDLRLLISKDERSPSPMGVLGECVHEWLTDGLRTASPSSVDKLKTWRRVKAISDRIIEDTDDRPPQVRCSRAHWQGVADHVRRFHPDDRNLPRTAATVEEYFRAYCSDCEALVVEDLRALYHDTRNQVDVFEILRGCVEALRRTDPELANAVLALLGSQVVGKKGDGTITKAAPALYDCMKGALAFADEVRAYDGAVDTEEGP